MHIQYENTLKNAFIFFFALVFRNLVKKSASNAQTIQFVIYDLFIVNKCSLRATILCPRLNKDKWNAHFQWVAAGKYLK